ncbi:citrate lyase holo-[acyl-carrier protein] synthase [Loigolactobacillus zhaoyuanensis]|uniref:citrate lyase holo-[acyl-carrier protein] synthase n=1 Tax=Loigolactobacillus zhaoyuanensis TaxID=2486017 RepID=A0ABW8UAU3_9LACO|nr:citrate lyase holo-[acyl-carrier protein] synthase [Loigolactobacillus zhaoyuanensis]
MKNIFEQGKLQSLQDVMDNRDDRNDLQNELVAKYPQQTLVAIKLNIPGPIKNNADLSRLFSIGYNEFKHYLVQTGFTISAEINWNRATGCETFLVIEQAALALKKAAIQFEDGRQLGRLFDIDVMDQTLGHLSRRNFDLPVRTCLICSRPAKACARSRRHSVAILQQKISEIYATLPPAGEQ